jgi:hypothetical protein
MVLVGVPVAVTAVISSFLTGDPLIFEEYTHGVLRKDTDDRYRFSRLKLQDSPYVGVVLTSARKSGRVVTKGQLSDRLVLEFKEQGIPFIQGWSHYMISHLSDYLKPLHTFNVAEEMFLIELPSSEKIYELLMPHLTQLKDIAENEVSYGR